MAAAGPVGPPMDQARAPPEVTLQGAEHAGAVVPPVFVPAKTIWQVEGEQVIGLPPSFFIEIEMATGEADVEDPALTEAPTTVMLELEVALLTRLYTDALTTPPTPRTAAMMMNRSMLCEIAFLRPLIFIAL